jgi:hypothetical protein
MVTGNDTSGMVIITTGTDNLAGGDVCNITFAKSFEKAPHPVFTAIDKDSATVGVYVSATTTTMTIAFSQTPAASHAYSFNYVNLQ